MKAVLRCVLMGGALAMAAPAWVQDVAGQAAAAQHPVQLSKVILDSETNPVNMRVKGGTLCVFPNTMEFPKEKKTQDYERFDSLFAGEMKQRGFAVVSNSQDLFASENSDSRADYLIGATMMPQVLNLCSSVDGWKGDVTIVVEWQIFDRAAQKVVETARTTGGHQVLKFAQDGYTTLWNRAFVANLDALVQQGVLQKYTGAPAPLPAEAAPPSS